MKPPAPTLRVLEGGEVCTGREPVAAGAERRRHARGDRRVVASDADPGPRAVRRDEDVNEHRLRRRRGLLARAWPTPRARGGTRAAARGPSAAEPAGSVAPRVMRRRTQGGEAGVLVVRTDRRDERRAPKRGRHVLERRRRSPPALGRPRARASRGAARQSRAARRRAAPASASGPSAVSAASALRTAARSMTARVGQGRSGHELADGARSAPSRPSGFTPSSTRPAPRPSQDAGRARATICASSMPRSKNARSASPGSCQNDAGAGP